MHTTIRDLHRRRGRERRGLCLAEGIRLVEEAVDANVEIVAAVASPALDGHERGRSLRASLASRVSVTEVSDHELTELATTEHPQGIVAVVVPKAWTLQDIAIESTSVVVILDAVQDPGNVGTIARTAWALGAGGVIALPGTAEFTNPKTLRATMGAPFRLPVLAAGPEAVGDWIREKHLTVATTAVDGVPITGFHPRGPLALVLGNEGQGARSMIAERAAERIAIPIARGVDSLNVAVAAGILLYEVTRGR